MGTHCHIGIEQQDRTIKYIEIYLDGYFSSIVPILREYVNREDIEKLINHGNTDTLTTLQQLRQLINSSESERPRVVRGLWGLVRESHSVGYIYVFTLDNKWLCHKVLEYFEMDELKY
jgi:hypothetical protein